MNQNKEEQKRSLEEARKEVKRLTKISKTFSSIAAILMLFLILILASYVGFSIPFLDNSAFMLFVKTFFFQFAGISIITIFILFTIFSKFDAKAKAIDLAYYSGSCLSRDDVNSIVGKNGKVYHFDDLENMRKSIFTKAGLVVFSFLSLIGLNLLIRTKFFIVSAMSHPFDGLKDIICSLPFIITVVCGVFVIGMCKETSSTISEYKRIGKEIIIKPTLMTFLEGVAYSPNEGYSERMVKDTGLLKFGDMFYTEDLIKANYKGQDFSDCKVAIKELDEDGKCSCITRFVGEWTLIKFLNRFNAQVEIVSKNFIGYNDKSIGDEPKFAKILTGNEVFDDRFDTYTEINKIDYVKAEFNDAICRQIVELDSLIHMPILIGINGNELHILSLGVKNKGSLKIFKKVDGETLAERKDMFFDVLVNKLDFINSTELKEAFKKDDTYSLEPESSDLNQIKEEQEVAAVLLPRQKKRKRK